MKRKIIYLIVTISVTITAKAQISEYTAIFDSVLQHVSRVTATTGVLYERVVPFSGLARFGITNNAVDTINSEVFLQGYSEMYHAAFDSSKRLALTVEDLQELIIKDISLIDIA